MTEIKELTLDSIEDILKDVRETVEAPKDDEMIGNAHDVPEELEDPLEMIGDPAEEEAEAEAEPESDEVGEDDPDRYISDGTEIIDAKGNAKDLRLRLKQLSQEKKEYDQRFKQQQEMIDQLRSMSQQTQQQQQYQQQSDGNYYRPEGMPVVLEVGTGKVWSTAEERFLDPSDNIDLGVIMSTRSDYKQAVTQHKIDTYEWETNQRNMKRSGIEEARVIDKEVAKKVHDFDDVISSWENFRRKIIVDKNPNADELYIKSQIDAERLGYALDAINNKEDVGLHYYKYAKSNLNTIRSALGVPATSKPKRNLEAIARDQAKTLPIGRTSSGSAGNNPEAWKETANGKDYLNKLMGRSVEGY